MEKYQPEAAKRPFLKTTLIAVGMGITALAAGCSWNDFNPAPTVSDDADPAANLTKEIQHNYPGASHITVVHSSDNPNYMRWDMPDGTYCTATASQTQNNGQTPGELITQPFCRPEVDGGNQ